MNTKANTLRRLLALVLTMALTFSLTVPALADEEDTYDSTPLPVTEEERTAWRDLDPDEVVADVQSVLDAMVAAAEDESVSDEDVNAAYIEAEVLLYVLATYIQFAYWDYYREPDVYYEGYAALSDAYNTVAAACVEAIQATYAARPSAFLGDETIDDWLNTESNTEEQLALLSEETELINAYYAAMAEEEIYYDQVGEIYIRLLRVHNELAQSYGCENYAEYAYAEVFGRDYTPEEAAALCREILEQFLPIFVALCYRSVFAYMDTGYVLYSRTSEEIVAAVQSHLGTVSDELSELFDYMSENNLLDTEDLDTKVSAGFTSNLPAYGSAYIYFSPDYLNLYDLAHEFGHFSRYCFAGVGDCYDVAEIHSQGLEALYTVFADDFAKEGEDAAGYVYYRLFDFLYDVVLGAIYSLFEIEANTAADPESLTVDDLNTAYAEILTEYGFISDYPEAWCDMPHFFTAPCYFMSYTTSAMNALELQVIAADDFDTAVEKYMTLLTQPVMDGYSDAVTAAGLTDVFSDGAVETLAAELTEYIENFISDYYASKLSVFTDIASGSYYADAVAWAVINGITTGTSSTTYSPDDACTRAQAVTLLWRAAGSPEASSENPFDDVSEDDYCYTAVLWALERGITTGTSETTFSPDDTCTRAEIVALLYRAYKGTAEAAGDFADVAADAWYAPAVAWAVDNEITTGTSEEAFSPDNGCTRGQIVTFLYRAEN
ncbi:MAG: S-layer homology domain-containing protein [Oscillospiraceae bacterium]|nr:S-layer homology domain-containing protein [Oscillospiraceae bacterium]